MVVEEPEESVEVLDLDLEELGWCGELVVGIVGSFV